MSLRILFADDSMTAQSMGKKILTEAGYEVVAVSNGAAAVKKIAEQKPDIIILDVYMPGYSGLEVCEKVRGSIDTLKTPVLLTYGKMEHYRPEDGHRVRADGVIVKPFEASDLLAIVKKLEERVSRAPARVEQPVLVEHAHQESVVAAVPPMELPVEAAEPAGFAAVAHSTVEVPDHMAGNSVFGEMLGSEPLPSIPEMNAASPAIEAVPAPPPPMPRSASVPEYEVPVSWKEDAEAEPVPVEAVGAPAVTAPGPRVQAVPVEPEIAEPKPPPVPDLVVPHVAEPEAEAPPVLEPAAPERYDAPIVAAEPQQPGAPETYPSFATARPLRIPVYQEPESSANSYEFMPTSTPVIGEIPIPREPQLQETAEETTRKTVADSVEPGLMTTRQQFEWEHDHHAQVEAAELAPVKEEPPSGHFQDIPAEIARHAPPPMAVAAPPEPESPVTASSPTLATELEEPKLSEDDFEARVAAAMAAYKTSGADAGPGGYQEPKPDSSSTEMFTATPVQEEPVEYHPPVHYQPAVETAPAEPQPEPEVVAHAHEVPRAPEYARPEPEHKIPTFEYQPPVSAPEPAEEFHHAAAPAEAEPEAVLAAPEPEAHSDSVKDEGSQAAVPAPEVAARAAVAAAGAGADHQAAVSQAVHRVMERLKPELVEEILRELRSKE